MRADSRAGPPLNILLLCNRPARSAEASAVTDHLDALVRYSRHRVQQLSFIRELPSAIDLTQFDAIVIHWTVAIGYLSDHYISPASKQRVRDFGGLKAAFIQDEYRGVYKVHDALRFMGTHVLFTNVPEDEYERVYPDRDLPALTKVTNLTGYVSDALVNHVVPPINDRPIDVGYRTRKTAYWLGELSFGKWDIADRFAAHARDSGLRLDLSYHEADRLYGGAWTRFMMQCKAMLGVETGASVIDFDGTLQSQVDDYVAAHPTATFYEVQAKFLAPYEGRIKLNQISPRCFEAAALRTSMVLYEGEYSGILKPGRHYVPLRKDFSNFPDVLETLRDPASLQRIADCAYEEVARNDAYSYRAFVRKFDGVMEDEFVRRSFARSARYSTSRYVAQIAMSPGYLFHRGYSHALQWVLLGTPLRRVIFRIWGKVPFSARQIVRPLLRLIGR